MRRQGEETGGDVLVSEEQRWSQMKKNPTTLKRWRDSERDAASIRLSAQAYLIKYVMPFEVVEYSWSTEEQG